MVYTANWVIIYYLPPFTGTWKIHWKPHIYITKLKGLLGFFRDDEPKIYQDYDTLGSDSTINFPEFFLPAERNAIDKWPGFAKKEWKRESLENKQRIMIGIWLY